jgi:RNA-directed DNA polymerase
MNTATPPVCEWNDLVWKTIEKWVFKLQKRIYQASQRGDTRTVHNLQRLLMKSWSAKLLATRRVTQDNQGKQTAGVDGVKSLTPPQRLALAASLSLNQPAAPARRVWIPKPGTTEQRPLAIPTINNRAAQALVKLALEPEWEAQFEPNSYGFRPGRSCHDAIEAIFQNTCHQPKYVLDADIAKCFDRIDHRALLAKLHTFPSLRRVISRWLEAGVMDGPDLFPTHAGVPQGGVLSPLLANVALHGLETAVKKAFSRHKEQGTIHQAPQLIRYADDLVVLHTDGTIIERAQQLISAWLADMGLELKPSKTRITHTLTPHNGHVGFDFLGFHVRQFPVGKTHAGKTTGRYPTRLTFKTFITPSKTAQQRHQTAIAQCIARHRAAPQTALIQHLNPIIHGWSNYFATAVSSAVFSKMGHLTYLKLRAWARRRHPTKSRWWIADKYWHRKVGTWNFATPEGLRLYRHNQTPIRRFVKVQGAKSPYDGDWGYWTIRMGRHPEAPARIAGMLRRQKGKCPLCGLYLKSDDLPETDHVLPTNRGGRHHPSNWQLVHRHCHDWKTARDGSNAVEGTDDNSPMIEEPDD